MNTNANWLRNADWLRNANWLKTLDGSIASVEKAAAVEVSLF